MTGLWKKRGIWAIFARILCLVERDWAMLRLIAACIGGTLVLGVPSAIAAPSCGVTGQAQAAGSITYNPFSSNGIQQVTIPIVLTRFSFGSAKTKIVNFVLTKPQGAPAYQVLYQGASVLYTEGATGGHPSMGSQSQGEIYYDFGGGGQPDQSAPFDLVVTVPANVDLSAGQPIRFDIVYVCNGIGGMTDVSVPMTLSGAVQINVNVQSALQASYVGSPLDFGNITDLTPSGANTHTVSGAIRVASSGPYSVSLEAQNKFRMTYPGGNPDKTDSAVRYSATFVGQTRSIAQPEAIVMKCSSNGIHGRNLPILLRLIDGGVDKIPSSNYRDTLTITVTPHASLGSQPPTDCSGL